MENRIDPKECNVPNICFSLSDSSDRKDKRDIYRRQRLKRGFDSTELWNLETTIGAFIYPRLLKFRDAGVSHPCGLTEKEWKRILNDMLCFFKYYYLIFNGKEDEADKHESKYSDRMERGIKLFAKYYGDLWY